jgi:hypothetical protein
MSGRLFGTDGVRGLANGLLTAELATNLGVAAAQVLGERGEFAETATAPGDEDGSHDGASARSDVVDDVAQHLDLLHGVRKKTTCAASPIGSDSCSNRTHFAKAYRTPSS